MINPPDMLSIFPGSTASVVQYQLREYSTPGARSLITQAFFCGTERNAMLTSSKMVTLSADMRAYLEYEAGRRGIDIATVYEEEMASRKLCNQESFSINELKALAAGSRPDPRLLEGDEECPF